MGPTMFVGLDGHKRTTSLAIAEAGRGGEVRFLGEIASMPGALHPLVERLKGHGRRLSFCSPLTPPERAPSNPALFGSLVTH